MSIQLGYEAIVNNLNCKTINGQPLSSISQQQIQTTTHQITITGVTITGGTQQITVTGTQQGITPSTPITIVVNSSNSPNNALVNIAGATVAQLTSPNGVTITNSGYTFATNTTYWVFVLENSDGQSSQSLGLQTTSTNASTHTITNFFVGGYIGDNNVWITLLTTNIPNSTTISIAYNTVNNQGTATTFSIMFAWNYNGTVIVGIPITLVAAQTYYFWATENGGSATSSTSFIPTSVHAPGYLNIVNVNAIPTTNTLILYGNFTGLQTGYVINVYVGTSSGSQTLSGSISQSDFSIGANIQTGTAFAANTAYWVYVSVSNDNGTISSSVVTFTTPPVATPSLSITGVSNYLIGSYNMVIQGTSVNVSNGSILNLYVNTANTFSGSTLIGSTIAAVPSMASLTTGINFAIYNTTTTGGFLTPSFTFNPTTTYYVFIQEPVNTTTSSGFSIANLFNYVSIVGKVAFYDQLNLRIDPSTIANYPGTTAISIYVSNNSTPSPTLYGYTTIASLSSGTTITRESSAIFFNNSNTYTVYVVVNNVTLQLLATSAFVGIAVPDLYPPIPLTQSGVNNLVAQYGSGQYVATASSINPGNDAFQAFDNSSVTYWQNNNNQNVNNTNTWIQLALPTVITLAKFSVTSASGGFGTGSPSLIKLLTSPDGINFYDTVNMTSLSPPRLNFPAPGQTITVSLTNVIQGNVFRIQILNVYGTTSSVLISDIKFYGISLVSGNNSTGGLVSGLRNLLAAPVKKPQSSMTLTTTPLYSGASVLATGISPTALSSEVTNIYSSDATTLLASPTIAQLQNGFVVNGLNSSTIYNLLLKATNFSSIIKLTTRSLASFTKHPQGVLTSSFVGTSPITSFNGYYYFVLASNPAYLTVSYQAFDNVTNDAVGWLSGASYSGSAPYASTLSGNPVIAGCPNPLLAEDITLGISTSQITGTVPGVNIKLYAIYPRNDATNGIAQCPKTWYLCASNDNINWTLIDTQTNVSGWALNTPKYFNIATYSGTYVYYQLFITNITGVGTNQCGIGEWQLYA